MILGLFEHPREMMLLGANLGELQGAPKTFGGLFVPPELLLQLARDGVVKMMRLDEFAPRHFVERREPSLGAMNVRDRDGAIEGDDRRRIAPVELIVMAQDALPVGRSRIRREAMTGRNAGLQMVVADRFALGRRGEMHQAFVDERLVPLRTILIIEPEQIPLRAQPGRKTRAAQQHEREQGVTARRVARGMHGAAAW